MSDIEYDTFARATEPLGKTSGHVAHIALSTMERQRNEARAQVIALLNALGRLPVDLKRAYPDSAVKAITRAQAYAEAWQAPMQEQMDL